MKTVHSEDKLKVFWAGRIHLEKLIGYKAIK